MLQMLTQGPSLTISPWVVADLTIPRWPGKLRGLMLLLDSVLPAPHLSLESDDLLTVPGKAKKLVATKSPLLESLCMCCLPEGLPPPAF